MLAARATASRSCAESRVGQAKGRDQARRVGAPGAGDIESGAVVRRSAHERQAKRNVDPVVESQRLDRDQRLVVIHGERDVVGRPRGRMEHGVGRQRTARVDAERLEDAQPPGRTIDEILVAERAFLAGMRIEAGDGKPRACNAEAVGKVVGDDAAGFDDQTRW